MNTMAFIAPVLVLSGVGVLALVAVAIVQDFRQERKYGYRQAFYTIVSLVMIALTVFSAASLLTIGLKKTVFTKAIVSPYTVGTPPFLTLAPTEKTSSTDQLYSCTTDCQFTDAQKRDFGDWKVSYRNWLQAKPDETQLRQDLAAALALLIIAGPLYFLFARWMNRGAAEETKAHQRPSPLRSVYFYGVAFAGLILAVVSAVMIINTGFRSLLHVQSGSTIVASVTSPDGQTNPPMVVADSVIACQAKCGFTADDVSLVKQWKNDYQASITRQTNTTQNDLAATIPLLILGAPIFWYHFARIRKETQSVTPTLV